MRHRGVLLCKKPHATKPRCVHFNYSVYVVNIVETITGENVLNQTEIVYKQMLSLKKSISLKWVCKCIIAFATKHCLFNFKTELKTIFIYLINRISLQNNWGQQNCQYKPQNSRCVFLINSFAWTNRCSVSPKSFLFRSL